MGQPLLHWGRCCRQRPGGGAGAVRPHGARWAYPSGRRESSRGTRHGDRRLPRPVNQLSDGAWVYRWWPGRHGPQPVARWAANHAGPRSGLAAGHPSRGGPAPPPDQADICRGKTLGMRSLERVIGNPGKPPHTDQCSMVWSGHTKKGPAHLPEDRERGPLVQRQRQQAACVSGSLPSISYTVARSSGGILCSRSIPASVPLS